MRKLALLGVIVAIVMAAQPGTAYGVRPFASPFQSPMAALGEAAVRPERIERQTVIQVTATPTATVTPPRMLQRFKTVVRAPIRTGSIWRKSSCSHRRASALTAW